MTETTTIQVSKPLVRALQHIKEHPRQTYNEIIAKAVAVLEQMKARNQYDEFLHQIQQPKMKELWDNPEDEAWEHV